MASSRTRLRLPRNINTNQVQPQVFDPVIVLSDSESDSDVDYTSEYVWDMRVTRAVASLKKSQVLHFPKGCITKSLGNRIDITIKSENTSYNYPCNILTAKRSKREKFIGRGWYEFIWYHKPKPGDVLSFTLTPPPHQLYVRIIPKMRAPQVLL